MRSIKKKTVPQAQYDALIQTLIDAGGVADEMTPAQVRQATALLLSGADSCEFLVLVEMAAENVARDHEQDVVATYRGEGDPAALLGPAMEAGVREAVIFWVQESINRQNGSLEGAQDDGEYSFGGLAGVQQDYTFHQEPDSLPPR